MKGYIKKINKDSLIATQGLNLDSYSDRTNSTPIEQSTSAIIYWM